MRIEVDEHYTVSFYSTNTNVDIFLTRDESYELFNKLADEYDFELHRRNYEL
jgi:hypothetical protein